MESEKQLNVIRGKILSGTATSSEIIDYFIFVDKLEELVEEASMEDFYGTCGWKRRMWGTK